MKYSMILVAFLSFTFLTACQTYKPVVDTQTLSREDQARYDRDQYECRVLAEQTSGGTGNIARDTAVGGAVGAGTGSLIGVITGDTVKGLALGSVIGGVAGLSKGVSDNERNFENIYRNCMRNRGYNVLN